MYLFQVVQAFCNDQKLKIQRSIYPTNCFCPEMKMVLIFYRNGVLRSFSSERCASKGDFSKVQNLVARTKLSPIIASLKR